MLVPLTLVLLAALIGGGAAVASAQQGDTFEEAIPISEGEETGSIDGTSTFYTLEANSTDALDVEFTAESAVLVVTIYDRNREEIASDGYVDSETTQLTTKLPSTGTYYIEVAPYEDSSTSDYTLNTDVITPAENDDFAPNDDFDSAASIDQQFTDAKIWGGESDFYRLEANTTDALDVRLTPQNAELAFTIYDQNRESIASDGYINSGDTGRATKKLPANGTYYIEVMPYSGLPTTEYTLNTAVVTPADNDAFAPNDGFESAAVIEQEFSDATIWGGESDFYRVGLNSQEDWTVDLTTQQAEMEFSIYAPNGTQLASDSYVSDTDELSISASQAGSYYLEVTTRRSATTTDYTIQSTQTGDPNTPPTAAFTTNTMSPTADEPVTFDANGSTDPDGSIISYEWDFNGDRTTDATGSTATYAYQAAGKYDVSLTVTDDYGAVRTTSRVITVKQAADPAQFEVETDAVDRPVTAGQQLSVTTTVENVGEEQGTQETTLDVPGVGTDSVSLSLAGGESETVTLTTPTTQDDVGEYTATVATENDSTPLSIVIEDQSDSAQVQVTNVRLTPQSVDLDPQSTHQLTFRVQNVSADGSEDEVDITFPDKVDLVSFSDVAIDEKSSDVNRVDNTLEFSVDPTGGGSTQISGELNVTVSATN